MTHHAPALLPVNAAALTMNPGLLDAVREFGRTYGYDYLDDETVRLTLAEHQASLRRTAGGGAVWAASVVGTVGLVWLLWGVLSKPENIALAVAPPAVLILLAVAAFVWFHRKGLRQLRHPVLEGYRHVLAAALAYGAPVTEVPLWLTGRGGGSVEIAPLPAYTAPPGEPARPAVTSAGTAVPLPDKPTAVTEYERIAERGGWHDEAGWGLIVAGAVCVSYAVAKNMPAAYAAILLVGLGIWIWVAGHRLGKRQNELATEARRYVDRLAEAQASGAVIPELSPPLRRLFDSRF